MTNCPQCAHLVQCSKSIVRDYPVYACRNCRLWWVEGHPHPIKPGPDLVRAIEAVVGITKGAKEARDRWQEMMDSDIRDPRWTQLA